MRITGAFFVCLVGLLIGASEASAITFCKTKDERNCFTGKFTLVDIPGDAGHKLLEADFGYVDPDGVGWQTNKDAKTDGASIPPLLQPFVGSPWEDGYIRAAVIHDWYCDRHVRAWKDTHRVFYNAMLASGLNKPKAKLLFYAVYSFGPRWGYLEPGTKCPGTQNCIQMTGKEAVFVQLPDTLNSLANADELKAMEAAIEQSEPTGGFTLDQLVAIADKAHPKQTLLDTAPSKGETK
ncbi:DUF1353 domain-containing protein [Labrys okinawensis]|uniref:DUF1353 domain-containing protein n=1 Tax=Labrys okinawensis TaxID=346911 RepID=UPI0039BCB8BF